MKVKIKVGKYNQEEFDSIEELVDDFINYSDESGSIESVEDRLNRLSRSFGRLLDCLAVSHKTYINVRDFEKIMNDYRCTHMEFSLEEE